MTLRPDDSLVVESELISPDGVILQKPCNLDQLNHDDGWYAVGDDLLKVTTTNTPLDEILVSADGSGTLTGDAVPRFIELLQTNSHALGDVEKNEPLQELYVFGESTENSVTVDGDAEALSVAPRVVFHGPKAQRFSLTADQLREFENETGFKQTLADQIVGTDEQGFKDLLSEELLALFKLDLK